MMTATIDTGSPNMYIWNCWNASQYLFSNKKPLEDKWFTQIHLIDSNITQCIPLDPLVSAWLILFLAKSWTAAVINVFFMCSPFREDPDLEINKIIYLEIDIF